MTISVEQIRDLLLPALREVVCAPRQWQELFSGVYVPSTPYILVPKMPLPVAVAAGVAAAVIKNPVITRRFWQGWTQ